VTLCTECSRGKNSASGISCRIVSCLVKNEGDKDQIGNDASLARTQLRRYLHRLAKARGESDGIVAALIATCSLVLSAKGDDWKEIVATMQHSTSGISGSDGNGHDAVAGDDVIGECWALLLPCNEGDSGNTAAAYAFIREGPVTFGRLVRSIRRSSLFWVNATHPVAAYIEKTLPTLREEDMDVALKSLKPLVSWAFRNDGRVLADNDIDDTVPSKKILRYRQVARLAQIMSSQGGGDEMEDGDNGSLPRDELDRLYQVIFPDGACLEHSCNPNCAVVCRQGSGNEESAVHASMRPVGLELLALRDVEEGESLTVSRMDGGGLELSVDSRASTLREIMGSNFTCQCARCRYERLDSSCRTRIVVSDTHEGNGDDERVFMYWKEVKALGDLAMQHGRHQDAEDLYSLVLKLTPNNGDCLHARAASYVLRGRYCKGQQLWREAHKMCATHKEISLATSKQKAYGYATEIKDVPGNEVATVISTNYITIMEGRCFITGRDSPILSAQECKQAVQWAEAAAKKRPEGWTTTRHYAVPTTDLPVHEVPCLLEFFNEVLTNRLRPLMAKQFGQSEVGIDGCGLHVHDAFIVRYDAEGGQRHLPVHTDDSSHSFTIALNDVSEYDGGGIYICSSGKSYRPRIGGAFTFRGDQIQHGGDPVVRGIRYVIVGFCYADKRAIVSDGSNGIIRKTKRPKLDEMFRPTSSATDKRAAFSFGFDM
jgi:hypothetical protein